MARLRGNLRQLQASLSPSVYRRYFAVIDSGDLLLREVHHFLWEFVEPEHPAMELPALQLRIPHVGTVMKRPPAKSEAAAVAPTDFEDTDVCSVILAAVERCVDADFHDSRPISPRRMYLTLLTMLTLSGVLYTADLVAQLMDIVKYSPLDRSRDVDAQRLLRYALRGSSATEDEAYRQLWRRVERTVDARVVGRYIASRDPWTTLHICYDDKFMFRSYPPPQLVAARSAAEKDAAAPPHAAAPSAAKKSTLNAEGVDTELLLTMQPEEPAPAAAAAPAAERQTELRTPEGLQLRWKDVQKLIERTGVLRDGPGGAAAPHAMEVFTGQAVFLRTVATGHRYSHPADALATQAVGEGTAADQPGGSASTFAEGMHLSVWQQLFTNTRDLHHELEKYIADHEGAEPQFECWEGLLVTLRCILNFAASQVQQGSSSAAESLFQEAAALRLQLVEQSLTRFGGRMRILWLQEA
ncbi:hypothetical protein STCU_06600 [Strigomonas culicis]|uniref:Uncharacterized protein n=1 Tax=Strigomonas culicis TaxID=28005 RepID=S9U9Q6_9TRYP|nr:hypothetical protein STCU_06600 [Strigomonas culicis]|eukprot:EPY25643.1 hypothetical protein STCU_06600 [Strigomonas culicis]